MTPDRQRRQRIHPLARCLEGKIGLPLCGQMTVLSVPIQEAIYEHLEYFDIYNIMVATFMATIFSSDTDARI